MSTLGNEEIQGLLKQAYEVALGSPDPSTQNGALLTNVYGRVLQVDYNRFPNRVAYLDERWERPIKYKYIEHAERNVIYGAARNRNIKSTEGLIMVCPWAACTDCARAIIQAGIRELITHKQAMDRSPERWFEEVELAHVMLREAGVEITNFSGKIGVKQEVLHTGEKWLP